MRGIYSPDMATREGSVAEYYAMAEQQPNDLVNLLVQTMANDPDVQVRQVSILMLRKAVIKHQHSLWPNLTGETRTNVKAALLHALHHETHDLMRRKLDDTVADLAAAICADGEWPELLDDLFALSRSEDTLHRESGLLIFGQLMNALTEMLEQHIPELRDIINNGMNDASLSVRISGLKATTGFIISARQPETRVLLQPLVPSMLGVLSASIQAKHSNAISSAMEVFIDWAIDPIFFEADMANTLQLMLDICNNVSAPSYQQSAAEFLVSLAARQPQYMASVPGYVESTVKALLARLMEVDDLSDAEWNVTAHEDIVDISTSDLIEECMDNFCLALGGRVIVPHIMAPLIHMINNAQEWRARYAGLMATSLIAEGCKKVLKASLGDLIALVLPRLSDENPRVRWAALNAVGQLAHDFAPYFQTEFHEALMPAVCQMYGDAENPKVQAIASSCIVSYSEKAPPETLIPYMDTILHSLHDLLSSTSKFVVEEAVTCVGAIAANAKEHFTDYYDHFVPSLKHILQHTHDNTLSTMRAKTIDTFSIVGEAVGKEKFLPDAREFMLALQETQVGEFGREDSLRETMLFAAARICRILKEDFVPFLPNIMPSLFETANMKEDVYLDVGEDTDGDETQREGWQYSIIGTRKFGIHNTALDEKNVAVRMIYCFVDNIREGIMTYIPQIVSTIIPLTLFPYHKGIRAAAVTILPLVLHAVKMNGEKTGDLTQFEEMFGMFFTALFQAINDEEFNNVLPVMIDAVSELVELIPEGALPAEMCNAILDAIQKILTELRAEAQDRASDRATANYTPEDEAEWDELDKWESDICTELADLYGVTVRTQPQVVLPLFQDRVEFIMGLLPEEHNTAPVRQVGLCIIDDSIEHLKEPMQPLLVHIVPFMIHYANDANPAVRQAASYGLGTVAQNGGQEMQDWLDESLEALIGAIESEGSREEDEFQAPTENAICAVGKIILYQPMAPEKLAELIPRWLSWLPLYVDQLEGRVCHGILMTLVEQNNPHLFGEGFQNLPKVLEVISWCLTGEGLLYINPEVMTRMRDIIRTMHSEAPELFASAAQTLAENQQEILSYYLTAEEPTQ
mgnify:CR=1 FL=1